jgi:hypothetical protein
MMLGFFLASTPSWRLALGDSRREVTSMKISKVAPVQISHMIYKVG